MHPDMLLLAERLVVAVERISQDMSNLSAYVYDLSYNMSHYLNEKVEKQEISLVPRDEGLPSGTPVAGHEGSDKSEYQYDELAGSGSVSHIDNLEIENYSVEDVASIRHDYETSDVSYLVAEEIKAEELSESEGNDDSCDVHNVYDNGRKNVRISKEIEFQTQAKSAGEAQSHNVHLSISKSKEQLNPSEFWETEEFTAEPMPQEIQCEETPSNIVINRDCSTRSSNILMAKTRKLERSYSLNTGEDPFRCHVCNKICNRKSNLVVHMRVHSGERPYQCSICEKAFKTRSDLERHTRVHSGEKPYKCKVCGKAFTQSGTLKIHMGSHEAEKPFKCTVCGKAFLQNVKLRVHMLSHNVEKRLPYI